MSEEANAVLAAWFCNDCYVNAFIAGFKHGVTSEIKADLNKTTEIKIAFVDEDGGAVDFTAPLLKREFTKSSHFKFEFFDPHGVAYDGPIDTQYVSYWGHLAGGQNCWGERKDYEYTGSFSESNQFQNSELYFADMRNDLLVLLHETGGYAGSTSGAAAIGLNLALAEFDGSEQQGCKTVNIQDAIKMPLAFTKTQARRELITLGAHEPYHDVATTISSFNVAASDRSGYSGGVAYDSYHWGAYAAIDETKPYNCGDASYIDLAMPDALEDYYNSWDSFGLYPAMDEYDKAQWWASFHGFGVNGLPNGTYDYPNFIVVDSLPKGSWAISATDKRFYSQRNRNNTFFAKLDSIDPEIKVKEFTNDTENNYTTYYPIAPV